MALPPIAHNLVIDAGAIVPNLHPELVPYSFHGCLNQSAFCFRRNTMLNGIFDDGLEKKARHKAIQRFGRCINPDVKMNYLASPPLCVAYALAGTMDIDIVGEPLGQDESGEDVYLHDIWPSEREVAETIGEAVRAANGSLIAEYSEAIGPQQPLCNQLHQSRTACSRTHRLPRHEGHTPSAAEVDPGFGTSR